MKNFFNPNSPFSRFMGTIADFLILNFLWVIGSIPIITIGVSTTALYACMYKEKEDELISPVKEFVKAYKANFLKSLGLSVVVAVCLAAFIEYVYLVTNTDSVSTITLIMMVAFCLLVGPALGLIFPLQARYENRMFDTIKNAFVLSWANLPTAIVVMILNFFPLSAFFITKEWFLRIIIVWILLGEAEVAYANTHLLMRIFKKYEKDTAEAAGEEAEKGIETEE